MAEVEGWEGWKVQEEGDGRDEREKEIGAVGGK